MLEGGFTPFVRSTACRIVEVLTPSPPNLEYPMTPVEKLLRMEDMLVQRVEALKREGSNIPKHYLLWLTLVADALNQHRREQA